MGIRDFVDHQTTATILRTSRLWRKEGISAQWFNRHYINGQSLMNIDRRCLDSVVWHQALEKAELTNQCIDSNANGVITWKGVGSEQSLTNIINTMCTKGLVDTMATGIWVTTISKTSLLLWRVRWGEILTHDKLLKRGAQIDAPQCLLCHNQLETITHIYV